VEDLSDDQVAKLGYVYCVHASLLQSLSQTLNCPLKLMGVIFVLLLLVFPRLLAGCLAGINEHEDFLDLGLFLNVLEKLMAVLPRPVEMLIALNQEAVNVTSLRLPQVSDGFRIHGQLKDLSLVQEVSLKGAH